MDRKTLGEYIKDARKAMGLTQREVAEKLGVKQSTYSNYENGYNKINKKTLDRIADVLEISDLTGDLFDRQVAYLEKSMSSPELSLYENETEQLMFTEELNEFRGRVDSIANKRDRRKVADSFSQILDIYNDALDYVANEDVGTREKRKKLLDINLQQLNGINTELMELFSTFPYIKEE